jgi:single-strand DNA-binding protein
MASFSVATTPREYNKETRDYVDGEAIFTNCTVWANVAENVAASLKKGSRVVVVGSLKSRTYQTRDGETKTATELIVDEIGASLMFATADIQRAGGGGASRKADAPLPGGTTDPASTVTDDEIPW